MTFFGKHFWRTSAIIKSKPRDFLQEYLHLDIRFYSSFHVKYFSELTLGKTQSMYL